MAALPKISADYAQGFKNALVIDGVPLAMTHPGQTFWVDANAGRTGRGTFQAPDVLIQTAIDRCVADRGDVVMCKPNHTEDVDSTTDIVLDCAAMALIGMGRGSNQAVINVTDATGYVNVTAADCLISGMYLLAGAADVAIGLNVAIGADGFCFVGNRAYSPSAILEWVIFMNIVAGANFISIIGNDMRNFVGSGIASQVKTIGESIGITIRENVIIGPFTESALDLDGTALTGIPVFADNYITQTHATADYAVEIDASTVGNFFNERYNCTSTSVPIGDVSASYFAGCRGTDAVAIGDAIFPKTTTDW
jgi:hypothetical protein